MTQPPPDTDYFLFVVSCLRPLVWIVGGFIVWRIGLRLPRIKWPYLRFVAAGMIVTGCQGFVVLTSAINSPIDMPEWLTDLSVLVGFPANIAVVLGLALFLMVVMQQRFRTDQFVTGAHGPHEEGA